MFDLREAAAAIGAGCPNGTARVSRVSTDSRALAAGDLFVALRGEKFDGHGFVAQAFEQGGVAAMVATDQAGRPEWAGKPLLVVDDTRLGLGALAAWWRTKLGLPLVGVTGSNGKTTVKEMVAVILREQAGQDGVLATHGNLNNDIGVPLTLLSLRPNHAYGVIEMGMNHPGEIAYLTALTKPNAAVVNNAQAAHLAGLGSVEAVARAKGEIFSGLGPEGVAAINLDDPFAQLWRELAGSRKVIAFGLAPSADVSADYKLGVLSSELNVKTPAGDFSVVLQVPGVHNVRNALAATAAVLALGVPPEVIGRGLSAFAGVKGRLQRKSGLHGAELIDDTYNANPGSVAAAIKVLAAMAGRRVLVLGDMGELGGNAAELHADIGQAAKGAGIDRLLALGEHSVHAARAFGTGGQHFEYIEDLLAEAENELAPEVTLLVKGSRFMQMERVVKGLEV